MTRSPLLARRRKRGPAASNTTADHDDVRRVCIVGSGWQFVSGISYYTCCMANALADRHDVSAVLMRRLVPKRLYPGSNRVGQDLSSLRYRDDVKCFDGVDYYWLPSIFRALRFIARENPQVVVFEWWTGSVLHSYLVLAAFAKARGARIVIEFHEVLDTGEAKLPFVPAYVRLLSRPLLSLTSGVAVHSVSDRSVLSKRFSIDASQIVVVPHGPYDHLVKREVPSKDDHDDGICDVLFFGTIRPYKGLEYLIQAFDSLDRDQVKRFRLTIVGETWEGWTLPSQLIEGSRYRDHMTYVNHYIHDNEVARYFGRADAVALPYLRSSASGPLHMAMSYGLPVVVSAVGGLVEAAADYGGVRFVRPGDVDDLRTALLELPAKAGQRFEDQHSWSASASQLATLFETPDSDGVRRAAGTRA